MPELRVRTPEQEARKWLDCRCCGKPVPPMDTFPIHTRCIPKHWDRHSKGINTGRCREFKNR